MLLFAFGFPTRDPDHRAQHRERARRESERHYIELARLIERGKRYRRRRGATERPGRERTDAGFRYCVRGRVARGRALVNPVTPDLAQYCHRAFGERANFIRRVVHRRAVRQRAVLVLEREIADQAGAIVRRDRVDAANDVARLVIHIADEIHIERARAAAARRYVECQITVEKCFDAGRAFTLRLQTPVPPERARRASRAIRGKIRRNAERGRRAGLRIFWVPRRNEIRAIAHVKIQRERIASRITGQFGKLKTKFRVVVTVIQHV